MGGGAGYIVGSTRSEWNVYLPVGGAVVGVGRPGVLEREARGGGEAVDGALGGVAPDLVLACVDSVDMCVCVCVYF